MVSELIRLWSKPGDGVVVHTLAYDAFYKAIEGNGRRVVAVEMENRWLAGQCAALEVALAKPKTKLCCCAARRIRTGKVWTRDELTQMAELCERYDVAVISDEPYDYGGEHRHTPWTAVARSKRRF